MKGWKGKAFLKSHFCQSLNPERQFCKSLNPQNPSAMQTCPQRERESDFARWKKARGRRQEKPPVGSRCYRRLSRSHGRLGRVWEAYGPQHWAGGCSILRGGEAGPSKGPDTQRSVGAALGQQGAGAWQGCWGPRPTIGRQSRLTHSCVCVSHQGQQHFQQASLSALKSRHFLVKQSLQLKHPGQAGDKRD